MIKQRLKNLDYLRGLSAFGIMLYHLFLWNYHLFSANLFVSRVGVYGGSIFYIISGLTLYEVYKDREIISFKGVTTFFKKRFLRVFPLFWLATFLTILLSDFSSDFGKVLLNITGLFAILAPSENIPTGAWSVGNELVFYFLFPTFFYLISKRIIWFLLCSLTLYLLLLAFSFLWIDPEKTLASQWSLYTNPLNHAAFFLTGFLIGKYLKKLVLSKTLGIAGLILALLGFAFYPGTGDLITIIAGSARIFFLFVSTFICVVAYRVEFGLPILVEKAMLKLGDWSYSIYLLHPIVYQILRRVSFNYSFFGGRNRLIFFSILFTLILSYVSYTYFEKNIMKLGTKKFLRKKEELKQW